MKKTTTTFLAVLSLFFSIGSAWANSPSITLREAIHIPIREKAEKITLFDKIHTNQGDLFNVEVVLSFQSGPRQRTKYSSYQTVLESKGKYTLAYSGTGDEGPLSQYFSEAIARKLALSRFQYQIRTGRKAEILSWLKAPKLTLPKEDIWALKQLGIKVPSTIKEFKG
jgi:hypothetical protein